MIHLSGLGGTEVGRAAEFRSWSVFARAQCTSCVRGQRRLMGGSEVGLGVGVY